MPPPLSDWETVKRRRINTEQEQVRATRSITNARLDPNLEIDPKEFWAEVEEYFSAPSQEALMKLQSTLVNFSKVSVDWNIALGPVQHMQYWR